MTSDPFAGYDRAALQARRASVQAHPTQIGLDYVHVELAGGWRLTVHFLPAGPNVANKAPRPASLTPDQIRLHAVGKSHAAPPRIVDIRPGSDPTSVEITLAGDVSAGQYRLELVGVPHLDAFFAGLDVALWPDSVVDIDPKPRPPAPPPVESGHRADYLARDYEDLRRVMLDQLAARLPDWAPDQAADLLQAVVEVLAYAGDQISYYQDAVATEAYLSTARQRISVRRHARLLGYTLHEGCNARAWVQAQVKRAVTLPAGTRLITGAARNLPPVLIGDEAQDALAEGGLAFETLHAINLDPTRNDMAIYDWGVPGYALPKGTTRAALRGDFASLAAGDVLILTAEDAPHAHPIRLIGAEHAVVDPVGEGTDGTPLTVITWHTADALPFALGGGHAHGNIVLVDQGRTLSDESLEPSQVPDMGTYRPVVKHLDLTAAESFDVQAAHQRPAAEMLWQDPRAARPIITLIEEGGEWQPRLDLLDSGPDERVFVVEVDNEGRAHLRFGDGRHGARPASGAHFRAAYRVGNGAFGNVGAGAITHLAPADPDLSAELLEAVINVTNPLSAQGGTDPEPIQQVKQHAPNAYRHHQQRAVIPADYVALVRDHPGVTRATATWRWTGSWPTVVLAIEPRDGPLTDDLRADILGWLADYRLLGQHVQIIPLQPDREGDQP